MQNHSIFHSEGLESDKIDRLVVLPFMKSVDIAIKSIRVRFFRSLITTISLVLAVAFLSFTRVGADAANGLLATGDPALRQTLIRSGYDLRPEDVSVGNSPKQQWIIVLSLLVCVVGIVNAQLMAVTERFREIGTMKCLGALDSFILRLFLLEAGIQGLIGSGAGAIVGAVFALIGFLLRFGTLSITALSWSQVGLSVAGATLTGCVLSLIGVMYPAIVAARMQPVEAMRVEQ
jgi:putative ABC transport system permease protein